MGLSRSIKVHPIDDWEKITMIFKTGSSIIGGQLQIDVCWDRTGLNIEINWAKYRDRTGLNIEIVHYEIMFSVSLIEVEIICNN